MQKIVIFIILSAKETYIGKATASKKSAIKNLCDVNSTVNIAQLLSAIGYEFLRTSATEMEDGGNIQTMKQRGFQLINPTEKWFPGIDVLRHEFSSSEGIVGKTPTFSVEKELALKTEVNNEIECRRRKRFNGRYQHCDA
ncbi:hypothetical protein GQX74_009313 [Glossina fuscipes]|nr:hypothetical protein GQX74_009313 [Glossina fuscipes]